MKNKKGFTLIELLGIIVILALIMLLIIPIVDTVLQKRKEDLYETQINNMSLALKNWGAENMFNLPSEENGQITVTLGQLKQGGFITEDIVNPITGECFPNDMLLTITKKGNNYKYEVVEESGSASCDEEVNMQAPIIGLKGRTVVYVEVNTPYVEPGLIVTKADGTPISQDKVQKTITGPKNFIDTSILGEYQITYKITDSGSTSSIIRTVIVRDTIPPVITVEKVTTVSTLGDPFDVMTGVSAVDNSGQKPTISSKGTVDTNVSGTYEIIYTAVDGSDNKSTEKRKVIVKDQTKPEIAITVVGNPFNSEDWANDNVKVKIESKDESSGIEKVYYCVSKNGNCTPSTSSRNSVVEVEITSEGTNNVACAYSVDVSGNKSATVCTNKIKIDKTAPTCTVGNLEGTAGNNGWFRSAVSVKGTCSDQAGLSGCVSPSVTSQYGSNTTGTKLSPGTVTDHAGNSRKCSDSSTFKIDMLPPSCNTTINQSVNSRGWYQMTSISATGNCTDAGGSGCTGNTSTTGGEGRYNIKPRDVSDNAGNTASCNSVYVQVDGTAPYFGGTITVKNDWGGHDVRHHHKIYDNVVAFDEMFFEYWWCYGGASSCGGIHSGNHFIQHQSTFGFVGSLGDGQHVLNSSNGRNGTVWFTWHVTDAAGNELNTCHYKSQWTNYTSGGYSGC